VWHRLSAPPALLTWTEGRSLKKKLVWQRLSAPPTPLSLTEGHSLKKKSVWVRITPAGEALMEKGLLNNPVPSCHSQRSLCNKKKRRRSKGGRGTLGSGKAVSHSLAAPEVIPDVSPPRLISQVLAFSDVMTREELNLRRALLVTVTSTKPEVVGSEVLEEVAHCFSIKLEDMTIQSAKPEDFLLFLPNEETAIRVLNGGKVLRGPQLSLVFKRWSRFSHASSSIMSNLVDVEIIGIPVHAWCHSTAEFILGDSGIIEEVHPDTPLQKTLPSFVARAWCF
jgi:hypothetical protein